jgi:hypothetical protein
MKNVITILVLCSFATASAQPGTTGNKHVLSTTLFKLESNSHTLFNRLRPKMYSGLEYERIFNRWSWATSLEYAFNQINEGCNKCADHYYGTGYLREYNVFTGLNYRVVGGAMSAIQLFIGTDMYYAHLNYSGDFGGGFTGRGLRLRDSYDSFGIRQRVGIHVYPTTRIRVTITTSSRFGYSSKNGTDANERVWASENVNSMLELKVGFLF